MKKILTIALILTFAGKGICQTDTSRLYETPWLMFPPAQNGLYYYNSGYQVDFNVYYDSAINDYGYTLDTLGYVHGDPIGDTFVTSNVYTAFYFTDSVPRTVYGVAATLNVYELGENSYLYDDRSYIYLKNLGEGDFGYWGCLYKPLEMNSEKNNNEGYFDILDSVWMDIMSFQGTPSPYYGSYNTRIRESRFIYDFDTNLTFDTTLGIQHDTTGLFEFYFDTPHYYEAGDSIFAGQIYAGMHGFKKAKYIVTPHYACEKDKYWGNVWEENIGDFTTVKQPFPIKLRKNGLFNNFVYPYIFPIIKLHCSTPRDWSMELEADSAVLSWQHFDGAEGYELLVNNVTQGDSSVLYIYDPDAVQYTLQGVDSNDYYRLRLRKLCRYATNSYDTIVRSEWTETFAFGTPPDTTTIDTSTVDTNIVDTTGILLANTIRLELQPNPASGVVELTMDATEGGQLSVTDLAGREVMQQTIPAATTTLRLDISQLPAGAYMVKLTTHRDSATRRLLVQ